MFLFAFVLEQLVHCVVFGSSIGIGIQNNTLMYALYGGLMAGLFEETGRFLAMHCVLKKEQGNSYNALMYGAGHGGFEMFVILSLGMINNLIYAVMINLGQTRMLLEPLDDTAKAALQSTFDALIQTPRWNFMISPLERAAAIIAQIGLSVIVWYAATGKKINGLLFILAIFLHAVMDAVSVLMSKSGVPLPVAEIVVWLFSIGIALIAGRVWKKNIHTNELC